MPILELDALPARPARGLYRSQAGAGGGWCTGGAFVVDRTMGRVTVLDPDGGVQDTMSIPPEHVAGPHQLRIDPIQRRVAVSHPDRALLIAADGKVLTIEHPAWRGRAGGDVAFDPVTPDRLWVVTPTEAVSGLMPQPPAGALLLVDTTTGAVVDRVALGDDHPEGYTFVAAPDRGVVLGGAYGQDGSQTWCLHT